MFKLFNDDVTTITQIMPDISSDHVIGLPETETGRLLPLIHKVYRTEGYSDIDQYLVQVSEPQCFHDKAMNIVMAALGHPFWATTRSEPIIAYWLDPVGDDLNTFKVIGTEHDKSIDLVQRIA